MKQLSVLRFLKRFITAGCVTYLSSQSIFAADYALPNSDNALVGQVNYIVSNYGDTPATIAQHFNLGQNALIAANPGLRENYALQGGLSIKIPSRFILPPLPRQGIVINLPEMRLYYYPTGAAEVMTFPVGIGRIGKTIPIANTYVVRKTVNPTWTPTEAIREFNRAQGIDLPKVMPAGPDNPLGPYAIYTGLPTYLIHSTIFPDSIGRRASFGCIRMNEGDIKQFFPLVEKGVPIAIINMPNKVGWDGDTLYLEAHPPLEERAEDNANLSDLVNQIERITPRDATAFVNWQLVSFLVSQPDGVPHEIGYRTN